MKTKLLVTRKLPQAVERRAATSYDAILNEEDRQYAPAEMVQKAAVIGVPVLIAVSAPTALAVRTAEAAGVTLVAIARGDGFEVFAHPRRIARESAAHVA